MALSIVTSFRTTSILHAAAVLACHGVSFAGEASLPSFDHAEGDPVEDDVIVLPSHTVVLLEGLYLLYGTKQCCCCNIYTVSIM